MFLKKNRRREGKSNNKEGGREGGKEEREGRSPYK